MRTERSEQRLVTGATKMRCLSRHAAAPAPQDQLHHRAALDAAFENFNRIDVGSAPNLNSSMSSSQNSMTTKAIIADITAQLTALDHQRQRLSALLRNVSI